MASEVVGARADMIRGDGSNARNGCRERGLSAPVGDVAPRIPKLGAGAYFPEGIIGRCSRAGRAVAAAVAESRANGVSTRKMERIARGPGIEGLSRDRVGAMRGSPDAEVGGLATRGPGGVEAPHLFLDATCVKCGRGGRAQSAEVVTAIGVGSDGVRRVLGLAAIDTETCAGRLGFLRGLRERGPCGVRLVVSDARAGPVRAASERLPGAGWQRRTVHLDRGVCSLLAPRRDRATAAKAPQAVFREPGPAAVRSAHRAAVDAVGAVSASAGAMLEDAEADALAYLGFPGEHGRRMRTSDVQERMNREIKRRSRVVQVLPSPESVLRLVGAVCAEQDEDRSSGRLHLARVDAQAGRAHGARARRERGVSQEGPHARRDGHGAGRHGEAGRAML